eukprot:g4593.t1
MEAVTARRLAREAARDEKNGVRQLRRLEREAFSKERKAIRDLLAKERIAKKEGRQLLRAEMQILRESMKWQRAKPPKWKKIRKNKYPPEFLPPNAPFEIENPEDWPRCECTLRNANNKWKGKTKRTSTSCSSSSSTEDENQKKSKVFGCGMHCLNRSLFMECAIGYCNCATLPSVAGSEVNSSRDNAEKEKRQKGKKPYCENTIIQRQAFPPTEVFRTHERGWGLRTLTAVSPGTLLCEYKGEVIDKDECLHRMRTKGTPDVYYAGLMGDLILDAEHMGSEARFANHSCDPNCEMQKWSVLGEPRIVIAAKRELEAGEEICYNYNSDTLSGAVHRQRCLCGSDNCSGFVGGKVGVGRLGIWLEAVRSELKKKSPDLEALKDLLDEAEEAIELEVAESERKRAKADAKRKSRLNRIIRKNEKKKYNEVETESEESDDDDVRVGEGVLRIPLHQIELSTLRQCVEAAAAYESRLKIALNRRDAERAHKRAVAAKRAEEEQKNVEREMKESALRKAKEAVQNAVAEKRQVLDGKEQENDDGDDERESEESDESNSETDDANSSEETDSEADDDGSFILPTMTIEDAKRLAADYPVIVAPIQAGLDPVEIKVNIPKFARLQTLIERAEGVKESVSILMKSLEKFLPPSLDKSAVIPDESHSSFLHDTDHLVKSPKNSNSNNIEESSKESLQLQLKRKRSTNGNSDSDDDGSMMKEEEEIREIRQSSRHKRRKVINEKDTLQEKVNDKLIHECLYCGKEDNRPWLETLLDCIKLMDNIKPIVVPGSERLEALAATADVWVIDAMKVILSGDHVDPDEGILEDTIWKLRSIALPQWRYAKSAMKSNERDKANKVDFLPLKECEDPKLDNGNEKVYEACNNETPAEIAEKTNTPLRILLALNKAVYGKHFTGKARLKAGTLITLPTVSLEEKPREKVESKDVTVSRDTSTKDIEKSKVENLTYKVGEKVDARYRGKSKWYGGRVIAINEDTSLLDIKYDDNDIEKNVRPELVRRAPEPESTAAYQRRMEMESVQNCEEQQATYCICGIDATVAAVTIAKCLQKNNDNASMLSCCQCHEWYHASCCHISAKDAKNYKARYNVLMEKGCEAVEGIPGDFFICPLCQHKSGEPSLLATRPANSFRNMRNKKMKGKKLTAQPSLNSLKKLCLDERTNVKVCGLEAVDVVRWLTLSAVACIDRGNNLVAKLNARENREIVAKSLDSSEGSSDMLLKKTVACREELHQEVASIFECTNLLHELSSLEVSGKEIEVLERDLYICRWRIISRNFFRVPISQILEEQHKEIVDVDTVSMEIDVNAENLSNISSIEESESAEKNNVSAISNEETSKFTKVKVEVKGALTEKKKNEGKKIEKVELERELEIFASVLKGTKVKLDSRSIVENAVHKFSLWEARSFVYEGGGLLVSESTGLLEKKSDNENHIMGKTFRQTFEKEMTNLYLTYATPTETKTEKNSKKKLASLAGSSSSSSCGRGRGGRGGRGRGRGRGRIHRRGRCRKETSSNKKISLKEEESLPSLIVPKLLALGIRELTRKVPTIQRHPVDLCVLFYNVMNFGGFNACSKGKGLWLRIAEKMGLLQMRSGSIEKSANEKNVSKALRVVYKKFLFPFELLLGGASSTLIHSAFAVSIGKVSKMKAGRLLSRFSDDTPYTCNIFFSTSKSKSIMPWERKKKGKLPCQRRTIGILLEAIKEGKRLGQQNTTLYLNLLEEHDRAMCWICKAEAFLAKPASEWKCKDGEDERKNLLVSAASISLDLEHDNNYCHIFEYLKSGIPPETSENGEVCYCLCRGPDDGRFMTACEECGSWFHGACVGIDAKLQKEYETGASVFRCKPCLVKNGKEYTLKMPKGIYWPGDEPQPPEKAAANAAMMSLIAAGDAMNAVKSCPGSNVSELGQLKDWSSYLVNGVNTNAEHATQQRTILWNHCSSWAHYLTEGAKESVLFAISKNSINEKSKNKKRKRKNSLNNKVAKRRKLCCEREDQIEIPEKWSNDEALFLSELYKEYPELTKRTVKVGGKPVNLFILFKEVCVLGGLNFVVENRIWKSVKLALDIPLSASSAGNGLKNNYIKYLLKFENQCKKVGEKDKDK